MDDFRSYNSLDKLSYEHLKVNHSKGFYALSPLHVNECESYNYLRTFKTKRGIPGEKPPSTPTEPQLTLEHTWKT